jgi:hypothetical protein
VKSKISAWISLLCINYSSKEVSISISSQSVNILFEPRKTVEPRDAEKKTDYLEEWAMPFFSLSLGGSGL